MLASVFAPLHGSISFGENIGCGHLTFRFGSRMWMASVDSATKSGWYSF